MWLPGEKKIEILNRIDRGTSLSAVDVGFGVGKSIVTDVKHGREYSQVARQCCDSNSLSKCCFVGKADDTSDRPMHVCLLKQDKGTPKSGTIEMEIAGLVYEEIYPEKMKDDGCIGSEQGYSINSQDCLGESSQLQTCIFSSVH